ncbi:hypothetical protein A2cp1_4050 [Anaeromyxobacter dehalogenans 2CP-1]|uniref:DUF3267 domain-containing protein n=1 Tax=Anaeromyxobacter dehalogenans (strain ATCC BAA-258 / DSM 21875 / 2CP-1) TaxID=455488 RepID=B8J9I0_ANAD2|nr:DUF3267 domain-containing protein [Anaeromyxobacter dehalogenans]ACL67368.1 hypothetical protein A2cp1_4050 [Anaeromyxobacter dehalogenans 2CP-1]
MKAILQGAARPQRRRVSSRAVIATSIALGLAGWAVAAAVRAGSGAPSQRGGLPFTAAVVAGLVAHELLHALAFLAAGARVSELRFGVRLRRGVAHVACARAVSARGFRFVAIVPGVALGLAPLVAGVATRSYLVTLFGAMLLAAAGGDLMLVWAVRDVGPNASIGDDPADPNVILVANERR